MAERDIIVGGGSAGAVPAMLELVRSLPAELPAAILLVVHTSPKSPGVLPTLLDRAAAMPVAHALNGQRLERGRVYVAPPDHHLLVNDGTIELTRGPRENGFRPAVDPLFRTAARAAGPRVIGVILSGGLDDGTEGLIQIKRRGGIAIVQDPSEAIMSAMPTSAIQNANVDHVVKIADMPALLMRLSQQQVSEEANLSVNNAGEGTGDVAEAGDAGLRSGAMPGTPSPFVCPECGGALWELHEGALLRYRCHVGHIYTSDSLLAEQTERVEEAMWTALRTLEEHAALHHRLASRSRNAQLEGIAQGHERQAARAEARATMIRGVLTGEPAVRVKLAAPLPGHNDPASRKRAGGNGGNGGSRVATRSGASRARNKKGNRD
jgi:two-component system chemotaxis response regulator CheB